VANRLWSAGSWMLKGLRRRAPFNLPATYGARLLFRVFRRVPAWAIRHLHRVGNVAARLPNGRVLRLRSRGDDWISNQVFWRGWAGYEPHTTVVFFHLAQRAAVTVDVGAYVGYYTLLAGHANPAGRVIALEPLPAIHARLLRHVSLNGLANVECLMAAAGAVEGRANFYHLAHGLPTSSSLSREFMSGVADVVATAVPVVTIDRVVLERGIARVDLVKIDTESTEPDVLQGMLRTLARDQPWVLCEVLTGCGTEERLTRLLEPLGYRFFLLTSQGPVPRASIVGHPECLNYLFVARDDALPWL
jgi:FkbM family methyltransferase